MPNWCFNTVNFTGEKKNLENLNKLLHKTVEIQEKTGLGQILHSLEDSIDGYMFNISNVECDGYYLSFNFDSRWSPIPNDIVRIAELFNLEFTYDYEESGMALYGKYTFEITDGESYLSEQVASDADIESSKIYDESGEEESLDYEKLETCIESNEMFSQSITRLEDIAT
jgi:hypothetical protein